MWLIEDNKKIFASRKVNYNVYLGLRVKCRRIATAARVVFAEVTGQCASVRGIPASSLKAEEYPPYSLHLPAKTKVFLWYLCVFPNGANKCFGIYMFFPGFGIFMFFQRKLTNAWVSVCFSR